MRSKRCPPAEAVPNDSHTIRINVSFCAAQDTIEQKTYIRHTIRDPCIHARAQLLGSLTLSAFQFRRDHLRVIESRDNIPVAAQVIAQICSRAPVPTAVMRVKDKRMLSFRDSGYQISQGNTRFRVASSASIVRTPDRKASSREWIVIDLLTLL